MSQAGAEQAAGATSALLDTAALIDPHRLSTVVAVKNDDLEADADKLTRVQWPIHNPLEELSPTSRPHVLHVDSPLTQARPVKPATHVSNVTTPGSSLSTPSSKSSAVSTPLSSAPSWASDATSPDENTAQGHQSVAAYALTSPSGYEASRLRPATATASPLSQSGLGSTPSPAQSRARTLEMAVHPPHLLSMVDQQSKLESLDLCWPEGTHCSEYHARRLAVLVDIGLADLASGAAHAGRVRIEIGQELKKLRRQAEYEQLLPMVQRHINALERQLINSHQPNFTAARDEIRSANGLLRTLCPVDVPTLLQLMEQSRSAGVRVQGAHVILPIGISGSGKTTTTHFLCGTEMVRDKFDRPVPSTHGVAEVLIGLEARVSHDTESVTKCVTPVLLPDGWRSLGAAAAVDAPPKLQIRGRPSMHRSTTPGVIQESSSSKLCICDCPGLEDTASVEVDIANGISTIDAIRQAASVQMVVFIPYASVGTRFQELEKLLMAVSQMIDQIADESRIKGFFYVFTGFQDRDLSYAREMVRQKLDKLPEHMHGTLLDYVLADLKQKLDKTTDWINDARSSVILCKPLIPQQRELISNQLRALQPHSISNPSSVFRHFLNHQALEAMRLQAERLKLSISWCLQNNENALLCIRLDQLKELSQRLPGHINLPAQYEASCTEVGRVMQQRLAERRAVWARLLNASSELDRKSKLDLQSFFKDERALERIHQLHLKGATSNLVPEFQEQLQAFVAQLDCSLTRQNLSTLPAQLLKVQHLSALLEQDLSGTVESQGSLQQGDDQESQPVKPQTASAVDVSAFTKLIQKVEAAARQSLLACKQNLLQGRLKLAYDCMTVLDECRCKLAPFLRPEFKLALLQQRERERAQTWLRTAAVQSRLEQALQIWFTQDQHNEAKHNSSAVSGSAQSETVVAPHGVSSGDAAILQTPRPGTDHAMQTGASSNYGVAVAAPADVIRGLKQAVDMAADASMLLQMLAPDADRWEVDDGSDEEDDTGTASSIRLVDAPDLSAYVDAVRAFMVGKTQRLQQDLITALNATSSVSASPDYKAQVGPDVGTAHETFRRVQLLESMPIVASWTPGEHFSIQFALRTFLIALRTDLEGQLTTISSNPDRIDTGRQERLKSCLSQVQRSRWMAAHFPQEYGLLESLVQGALSRHALHLRQQLIDVADLPTVPGALSVLQETVGLVDQQQSAFVGRLAERPRQVLLGPADVLIDQIGRTAH